MQLEIRSILEKEEQEKKRLKQEQQLQSQRLLAIEKQRKIDYLIAQAENQRLQANAQQVALDKKLEKQRLGARINLLRLQNQRTQFERNAFFAGGLLLMLLTVVVAAWLLNRSRLRRLQEAQALRQHIAHDLHDEMGSTLSSISLLSSMTNSLLAQPGPAHQTPELLQKMVTKIYTDTRQMQATVDEFIWMVKPDNDTLAQVAARIRAFAEPLMDSQGIRFQFEFDTALEQQAVSQDIKRNVYLLGKEAINNLIKYAHATEASMRFNYHHQQLRLRIEDNGCGFDATVPTQRTGQQSMQQRAKAMGGILTIRSAPGQGTALEVTVAIP